MKRILTIIIVLTLAALACRIGDPDPSWERRSQQTVDAANEMWHQQLTSEAGEP